MKKIAIFLIFALKSFNLSAESSAIAKNEWVPIFSCSGGSAHEVTAQILKEEFESQGIKTVTTNVTRSQCTLHAKIGKFFTDIWDHAQLSGNVSRQIFLLNFQKTFERIFYFPTYLHVKNILIADPRGIPNKIILTSPLFLSPICSAVISANNLKSNPDKKINSIELYMVEAPSDEAIYYYKALKDLSQEKRSLIRLFTLPPNDGDIATLGNDEVYWNDKAGLSKQAGQIIYHPPLRPLFRQSENLPAPGQDAILSLKAALNEENDFLKGAADSIDEQSRTYIFNISKEDKVTLLMLGSIPSEEALFNYVRTIGKTISSDATNKSYLFISCGAPKLGIYQKMVAFIARENFSSTLIPFTAQPVEKIFARADFTITRSGGMTTQEILSLKTNPKRNDSKMVLIHSGAISSHAFPSEEDLIKRGIPLWEAGNARYLKEKINEIHIVNPTSINSYILN